MDSKSSSVTESTATGDKMYALIEELFPICRSLTGNGVRETLAILKRELPGLQLHEVPSGTRSFDWTVPEEWNVRDAYVIGPNGKKVIDFRESNLHLVGYSEPVDREMTLQELDKHLYSLPTQPDAIPYVTSYYKRRWGFCVTQRVRDQLRPGHYQVKIDSELRQGHLSYGELIIQGKTNNEIFLSTYVCHPSMANNELSGPAVTCYLAKWLSAFKPSFTYRIVFIPETIGAITYLSRNLPHMKSHVKGGFNISCVGDERCFSYLPSRMGNTLSDRAATHVLQHTEGDFVRYNFQDRGSDERQYCSPGVDLPICCIMRSKYGTYPEYHTSLDNLDLVTAVGLQGSFDVYCRAIKAIEDNRIPISTVLCEPQLGSRGLYPTLSTVGSADKFVKLMMDLLVHSDGENDLLGIAELLGCPMWELVKISEKLSAHGLLRMQDAP